MRQGSFANAARRRGVTASTVSRAVAALEAELGFRLLQRTTRALSLTEAGERYVDRVGPLLAGLTDAARFARDAVDTPQGTVRATVPVSFALRRVSPWLPELRQRHPGVHLDLVTSDARVDLIDQRIDFGIRLGRVSDPHLVARRLFRVRYRLVASPTWVAARGAPPHPSQVAQLDALRFPLPAMGAVWRFRRGDEAHDVSVRGPLVVSNTLLLREAAEGGLGVTVLPLWLIDDALRRGTLVELLPEWEVTLSTFDASAWLVLPTRRYVPARVRAVADFLADRVGSRPR